MQSRARWWCAAALLLWAAAHRCQADTVLLSNGDRISGQITGLQNDKLSLKTEFAGDIQIDWKKVAQVRSQTALEVESDSGRKFRGPLNFAGDGVRIGEDGEGVLLSLLSIKGLTLPKENEGILGPLHGTVDLGYNIARGNSNLSTSSAALNSRYRTDSFQVQVELASLFSEQVDSPKNSRHYGSVRFDRYLSPKSFWFALGGMERDERRKLNLRSNLGGGLGYTLIKDSRNEASLLGGFTYVQEQFRDAEGGPSGEGLFGIDLRNSLIAGIVATNRLSLNPNLVQPGRYRFSAESGLRLPLLNRYVWGVQLYNRFDSRPPAVAKRNDYGAVSSFGVTF